MSRQLLARGIWGAVAVVACGVAAIAVQQTAPAQQIPAAQPNQAVRPTQSAQENQFGQPGQNNPQEQSQRRNWNDAQGNPGMAGVGRGDIDHYLIKVLVKANKDEIELGRLAQQRSQNPEIKQLATQMVEDHTAFLNKLESFKKAENNPQAGTHQPVQRGTAFRGPTPGATTNNGLTQQQPQQYQVPQVAQQQPGSGQPRMNDNRMHRGEHFAGMGDHAMAGQFAKIMEEVDQNMQQSLVRELSSKQGVQFDRCFLSSQAFGHMWVAEALKTFERNASPQLKPILQEGVQATEQHLTHIKSLLAKAENEPTAAPSTRFQPRGGRFNR
jgi:predicted outer membrane protein